MLNCSRSSCVYMHLSAQHWLGQGCPRWFRDEHGQGVLSSRSIPAVLWPCPIPVPTTSVHRWPAGPLAMAEVSCNQCEVQVAAESCTAVSPTSWGSPRRCSTFPWSQLCDLAARHFSEQNEMNEGVDTLLSSLWDPPLYLF